MRFEAARAVWQATHVESIREVTAHGRGRWYYAYGVELATLARTWTDSSGAHARTLHAYELHCLDPRVGSRYFSSNDKRQAFIARSFTDMAIREPDTSLRSSMSSSTRAWS